jgi:hypothetical protein
MWRNPKYQTAEPPAATPPAERGRRLAAIPRGRDEQLRISLDEFNGHPYVAVRVFARGQDGSWWPVRGKGLGIRLRELAEVAEALKRAEDLADQS